MSLTSQDVGNYAVGYKFSHRGRTYELRFVDDRLLAEFEREWFDLERDKLRSMKEAILLDVGEEYYLARMRALYEKLDHQEFTLAAYKESNPERNPVPGLLFMAKIVGVTVPELIVLLKESPELRELVEQVVRESSPREEPGPEGNGKKKAPDAAAGALAVPGADQEARAGNPSVL